MALRDYDEWKTTDPNDRRPVLEPGERCSHCNGSGEIAVSNNFRGGYRGPGPVPDDARGVIAVTCDVCGGSGGGYEEEENEE